MKAMRLGAYNEPTAIKAPQMSAKKLLFSKLFPFLVPSPDGDRTTKNIRTLLILQLVNQLEKTSTIFHEKTTIGTT